MIFFFLSGRDLWRIWRAKSSLAAYETFPTFDVIPERLINLNTHTTTHTQHNTFSLFLFIERYLGYLLKKKKVNVNLVHAPPAGWAERDAGGERERTRVSSARRVTFCHFYMIFECLLQDASGNHISSDSPLVYSWGTVCKYQNH